MAETTGNLTAIQLWTSIDGASGPQGTLVHPREIGMSVLWQL